MADYRIEDLPPELAGQIAINPLTGCWEWQGPTTAHGYGRVRIEHRDVGVHRVTYSLLIGPIPAGLEIDHVWDRGCRSHACCWPAHLEPVSHPENSRRAQRAILERRRTACAERAQRVGATARWATESSRHVEVIVDEVRETGKPVMIFKFAKPMAVIVPADWYEQARAALARGTQ